MLKNITGRIVGFAMTASVVIGASAVAAQDVRIGAMREGSSWYIFAATLEQMIEPALGANSVEIIARGGGVANPMVVQNGRAEIALSNVATARWALEGHPTYEGASAPDIRALVGGLNNVYIGVIARQEFIERVGTSDLGEIIASGQPFRLLIKPTGSSAVPAAELILEAYGSSFEALRAAGGDVIQLAEPQIADSIRNGNSDIYIDTMIRNHPTITEVNLTADTVFLDIPPAAMDLLEHNGLTGGTYGPWFDDQTASNIGANLGTVLIASSALSDETAYLITQTLVENAAVLGEAHAAWRSFDPAAAFLPANTGIPLHPGAERYYREAGLMN